MLAHARLLRTGPISVRDLRRPWGGGFHGCVIGMRRTGPGADEPTRELIRAAFAHRRKSLARSLEHLRPGTLAATRAALEELGLDPGARAESLAPGDFAALSAKLRSSA